MIVVALWAPGLRYPIVSDTARYALLGESLWQGSGYALLGEPYAKHLPLHALVAYPLVFFFGYSFGMKLASLLAGLAVICLTFAIAKRQFSPAVAVLSAAFVALHHGFVWMTVVGSADLLFTALFLFGVYAFLQANENACWYVLAGAAWGLACVTRYNGMPLLALYLLYGLWARPQHRRCMPYWCGWLLGAGIFSLWLLRNFRLFGDPFFTEYTSELGVQSAGPIAQLVSNFFYYLNPLQNILPVLLLLALYGLWKQGKQQPFLLWSMIAVLVLTAIWWVQAMRFAFPAYPLLIMFAVWGFCNFQFSIFNFQLVKIGISILLIISHFAALCLYSSGMCNARFDQSSLKPGLASLHVHIPDNLGLTSEGFYGWHQARTYINAYAPENAKVYVGGEIKQRTLATGVFREDIVLVATADTCPHYVITAEPQKEDVVVFTTSAAPHTSVVLHGCQ